MFSFLLHLLTHFACNGNINVFLSNSLSKYHSNFETWEHIKESVNTSFSQCTQHIVYHFSSFFLNKDRISFHKFILGSRFHISFVFSHEKVIGNTWECASMKIPYLRIHPSPWIFCLSNWCYFHCIWLSSHVSTLIQREAGTYCCCHIYKI